ncbi:MAG: tetratricopeptide repeat protein [Acidobacteriota bacterium]
MSPLSSDTDDERLSLIWPALIAALALGMRLAYLAEIRTLPLVENLLGDSRTYLAWAHEITCGQGGGIAPFYQAPGYPYFLAILQGVFGGGAATIRVIQCVLGSMSCVLTVVAGRYFFSARAGIIAGALLAVYPPAWFYDGLVQKASLSHFLLSSVLALLAWDAGRPRSWKPLIAGFLIGIECLVVELTMALVPVVFLWIWLRRSAEDAVSAGGRLRRRAIRIGGLLAGILLAVGPVAIRNLVVTGLASPTTYNFGVTFYIGNNPLADGTSIPLVPGRELVDSERNDAQRLAEAASGRELSPLDISAYWFGRSLEFIRAHPLRWSKLLGYKLLLVCNAYEIPDVDGMAVCARWSRLFRYGHPVYHFGVLLPLAAIGAVLTWPQRRRFWILYGYLLEMAAAIVLFYVLGRYRYTLVPALVLLAGAGASRLSEGRDLVEAVGWKRFLAAAAATIILAAVVNVPPSLATSCDAVALGNLGVAYLGQGDLASAARVTHEAVEGAPECASLHYNLGTIYSWQRRYAEAAQQYRLTIALQPDFPGVQYRLAFALEKEGRPQEAQVHYWRALERDPRDIFARDALERLGSELAGVGGSDSRGGRIGATSP